MRTGFPKIKSFPKIKKRKRWRRSGVMLQAFPTYRKNMMIFYQEPLKQRKAMTKWEKFLDSINISLNMALKF
jgi:hypothetical protein